MSFMSIPNLINSLLNRSLSILNLSINAKLLFTPKFLNSISNVVISSDNIRFCSKLPSLVFVFIDIKVSLSIGADVGTGAGVGVVVGVGTGVLARVLAQGFVRVFVLVFVLVLELAQVRGV